MLLVINSTDLESREMCCANSVMNPTKPLDDKDKIITG